MYTRRLKISDTFFQDTIIQEDPRTAPVLIRAPITTQDQTFIISFEAMGTWVNENGSRIVEYNFTDIESVSDELVFPTDFKMVKEEKKCIEKNGWYL